MATAEIKPYYAQNHLNQQEEYPTSLFQLNLENLSKNGQQHILIGTNKGRCLQLSLKILNKSAPIYEDPQQRDIVAIGAWPFPYFIATQSESQDEAVSSNDGKELPIIWLHFRASAIATFRRQQTNSSENLIGLLPIAEFATKHYGFCRASADYVNGLLFMPDYEDLKNILHVRHMNGTQNRIKLDEERLTQSWLMQKEILKIDGEQPQMFKGMLMGIQPLYCGNSILLAFEDSTICVFDFHTTQVLDSIKHPKHREFLCWSSTKVSDGQQTLIAVSVVGQLFLLSHCVSSDSHKQQLRAECVIMRQGFSIYDANCTALALCCGASSITSDGFYLAAGLKNGVIRIYLLAPSEERQPKWSCQCKFQSRDFHSTMIRCLQWMDDAKQQNDGDANSNRHPISPKILCSAAADGKTAFFELPT